MFFYTIFSASENHIIKTNECLLSVNEFLLALYEFISLNVIENDALINTLFK